MSLLYLGAHNWTPYSRCGLTIAEQWKYHLLRTAGSTLPDVVQDTICCLSGKDTLLACVQLLGGGLSLPHFQIKRQQWLLCITINFPSCSFFDVQHVLFQAEHTFYLYLPILILLQKGYSHISKSFRNRNTLYHSTFECSNNNHMLAQVWVTICTEKHHHFQG